MPKRGRLSHEEMAYIRANATSKSLEVIGQAINRSPAVVARFIRDQVPPPAPTTPAEEENAERITIRQELRNSESWKNLRQEFTSEELRYFEESYIKLMSQFRGDVLASEETQIFQAIKFEILMSRNLKERRKAREDIDRLEKAQEDHLKRFDDSRSEMLESDREFAMNLETQLNVSRQAEQSRTGEYVKLQERHDALMKSLKAVRDQRVKQLDSPKVSFSDIIKMLADRDIQERKGRELELTKLAGRMEYERLGRPIVYDDGNEDQPILSSDTVDSR